MKTEDAVELRGRFILRRLRVVGRLILWRYRNQYLILVSASKLSMLGIFTFHLLHAQLRGNYFLWPLGSRFLKYSFEYISDIKSETNRFSLILLVYAMIYDVNSSDFTIN